jgi:hypothetical protein
VTDVELLLAGDRASREQDLAARLAAAIAAEGFAGCRRGSRFL